MQGLFITGSDTGVGKTHVACTLARLLRRRKVRVRVSKPVATGGQWVGGRWIGDDTRQLAQASGEDSLEEITPWTFAMPAAPPVASREAGVVLDLASLAGAARRRWQPESFLIVEGVGGLLCPLTEQETVADLVGELGLPLVIVVRRSLGTLNHTLLTAEVARARGLTIAGVVVNETTPVRDEVERMNVEELRKRLDVPLLGVVPFHATPYPDWEVDALADVDWESLGKR